MQSRQTMLGHAGAPSRDVSRQACGVKQVAMRSGELDQHTRSYEQRSVLYGELSMLKRFQIRLFASPHADVYAWIRFLVAPIAMLATLAQYQRFGAAAPTALPSAVIWFCICMSGVAELMPARWKPMTIGLRVSAIIGGLCCVPWLIAALITLMQM
jgi:hypothetical protein